MMYFTLRLTLDLHIQFFHQSTANRVVSNCVGVQHLYGSWR